MVGLDVADLTEPELRQELLRLQRRVQKLSALLRLALALLRTSGFRLTGARYWLDAPSGILRAVDRAREYSHASGPAVLVYRPVGPRLAPASARVSLMISSLPRTSRLAGRPRVRVIEAMSVARLSHVLTARSPSSPCDSAGWPSPQTGIASSASMVAPAPVRVPGETEDRARRRARTRCGHRTTASACRGPRHPMP